MAQGGCDSCGTCPFNGVNRGKLKYASKHARDYFCVIREFEIEQPFWTYCNNHPLRNPLWTQTLRGPIWAAIYALYDSKPLNADIKIPPEFVPPQGDGNYFRIPYFNLVRPIAGKVGKCLLCGDVSQESVLLPLEEERNAFCSVAHYFEWWLETDDMAVARRALKPLDMPAIKAKLKTIPEMLAEGLSELQYGEADWVLDTLRKIDDLLMELRNRKMEVMHAALNQEDPEFEISQLLEELAPQLLQLQGELTYAGDLLREEKLDYNEIFDSMSLIAKSIGEYMRQRNGVAPQESSG